MQLAQPFITAARLSRVEPIAEGLEFAVFKAISPSFGHVALRVPKALAYENPNDPHVDAKDLLQQELRIYELLQESLVPVPKPFAFLESEDGYPATLTEYVDDDGSEASPKELGRVAALIHSTPIPQDFGTNLVAQETGDALTTLVQRIQRRMNEFVKEEPSAAALVLSGDTLTAIAQQLRRFPSCLLHMDFRDVNLRVQKGKIAAVIDWTNTLVGPAVIDLYRILELIRPDDAFLNEYTKGVTIAELDAKEEALLRLDAALMLALVFMTYAPDPVRRVSSIARVKELARALSS